MCAILQKSLDMLWTRMQGFTLLWCAWIFKWFKQDFASWRFKQRNIMRITQWSSPLDMSAHKEFNKIKFAFSWGFYKFWKFKQISMIFKWVNDFENGKHMNSSGLVFSPRPWCSWASGSIRLPLRSMPAWQRACVPSMWSPRTRLMRWLGCRRWGVARFGGEAPVVSGGGVGQGEGVARLTERLCIGGAAWEWWCGGIRQSRRALMDDGYLWQVLQLRARRVRRGQFEEG
jgi:hypothetical protein